MLKLKNLAPNQTELHLGDDLTVFFSYETPVAAFVSGKGYMRTEEKYSKTTTKHINQWFQRAVRSGPYRAFNPVTVPQYQIDALVNVVKVI